MFVIGFQKSKKNKRLIQILYDESKKLTRHVFLETCQRVEVYVDEDKLIHQIPGTFILTNFLDIYRHLFEVTSGLKAPILGETEIQGQVKKAYLEAIDSNHVSKSLHTLFQTALAAGKRVRRETAISDGTLTYAGLVLKKLKTLFPELAQKRIGLIGYGHLIKDFIYLATKHSLKLDFLSTRTVDKVIDLYPFDILSSENSDHLSSKLKEVDIVISATSDPKYVITPSDLPEKPLCFVDLASPPDVHPHIHSIKGITIVDLDQLTQAQTSNVKNRLAEVDKVNAILNEECTKLSKILARNSSQC